MPRPLHRLAWRGSHALSLHLRLFLILLLSSLLTLSHLPLAYSQSRPGYCSIFGHCANYTGTSQPIDCVNSTVALPSLFQSHPFDISPYCPHLRGLPVCCDWVQYRQFSEGFNELSFLSATCPACVENFRSVLCDLSCGGDQSTFLVPTATALSNSNGTVVTAANVSISRAVIQGLYDSCANVQAAAAGTTLFHELALFSAEDLFNKLIAGNSPVAYNWLFTQDTDPTPSLSLANLHRAIIRCDDVASNFSCSCGDCPIVCNRCPAPLVQNDTDLVVDGAWPAFGHNYLHPIVYASVIGMGVYVGVMLLAAVMAQVGGRPLTVGKALAGRVLVALAGIVAVVLLVYAVSVIWIWAASSQAVTVGDEAGMVSAFASYFDPVFFAFLLLSFIAMLGCLLWFTFRYTRTHSTPFHYNPASFTAPPTTEPTSSSTLLARYSSFIASHPFIVIACGVVFTGLWGLGLLKAQLQSDPIALWVSPSSDVFKDKQYFDDTFGPFYRTEQLILTAGGGPILTASTLLLLANLTSTITTMAVPYTDGNGTQWVVTHSDLCYRPIPGQGCVIESALEWFTRTTDDQPPPPLDGSLSDVNVTDWVSACANEVIRDACRGSIGAPTYPYIVLGGYNGTDYTTATALVVTFPLNNIPANTDRAKAWEAALLTLVQSSSLQSSITERGLRLDYMVERSIEDEISRGTYKDVDIIVLSYALMFLYISVALSSGAWGSPPSPQLSFPVHTKVGLGLCAILIVVFSLVVSVGVVSVLGIAVTPIISEVIPFLVLAIGIDNVFLLSQAFRRQPIHLSPATRLHLTLQEVGMGITLAAASECGAFLLGASTDIPAVQVFALMSAVAIAVDWLMQMTVFCAFMLLDAQRMEEGRWDLCPCIQNTDIQQHVEAFKQQDDDGGEEERKEDGGEDAAAPKGVDGSPPSPFTSESYLQQFLRRVYLPFLFHPFVRLAVLLFFPTLFFFLLSYGLTHIQLGLDQSTVVPDDSYLQGYFASEAEYLNVGPPVYFVIRNTSLSTPPMAYNYTDYSMQDRVCNAVSRCDDRSLEGLVSAAACTPGSYIAQPASSWMDVYMVWLTSPQCCQFFPSAPGVLVNETTCDAGVESCVACMNTTSYGELYGKQRPPPDVFEEWMQPWLINSTCSDACAFCSAGVFDSLTFRTSSLPNNSTPLVRTTVEATRYMSFHTPLRTQSDFIGAIKSAHALSDQIEEVQGLNVFPYSVVYVYFQQYIDIAGVAVLNGGFAFLAIFLLSLLLLRCVWVGIVQVLTIAMVVGDLVGCMALWGIDLNALSVLNLIMAIGISVEFCIHITTRFLLTPSPSRTHRAAHAMYTVGASVIEGITLTKVTGVLVLGLATSAVFHIYYFRMYLLIVLLGVTHGCVWLPVLLSVAGSQPQVRGEGWCGGWMWGWPWQRSVKEDEAWVVVDADGEVEGEEEEEPDTAQTSDDEGPDSIIDDEEGEDGSPRIVDVPIDDRRRSLLDEEAASRRVNTGRPYRYNQ